MRFWTWSEIRTKIEQECDLEDEDFVRRDELLAYANEAIDEAEAEIHTLYEDYFLKYRDLAVVANDEFFSLTTLVPDIYADKIRRLIFTQTGGTTTYTVTRLKDWKKFEEKAASDAQSTTDLYQYFILNQTAGNPQIMLVPKAHESGTLRVWYLRNANRLTVDADLCDIPEFVNFIFAHMKVKVYGKEGHPGYSDALERLETERSRMNAVLAARTPDAENEIEMDMSSYEDMN
jgi:hypothetical protein